MFKVAAVTGVMAGWFWLIKIKINEHRKYATSLWSNITAMRSSNMHHSCFATQLLCNITMKQYICYATKQYNCYATEKPPNWLTAMQRSEITAMQQTKITVVQQMKITAKSQMKITATQPIKIIAMQQSNITVLQRSNITAMQRRNRANCNCQKTTLLTLTRFELASSIYSVTHTSNASFTPTSQKGPLGYWV